MRKVYIQEYYYFSDYKQGKWGNLFNLIKLLGVTAASIYAIAVIHNINNT